MNVLASLSLNSAKCVTGDCILEFLLFALVAVGDLSFVRHRVLGVNFVVRFVFPLLDDLLRLDLIVGVHKLPYEGVSFNSSSTTSINS